VNTRYMITHYYHSGFSVSLEDTLVVFDYWRGEENELTPERELNERILSRYSHVYVFISHEHMDHMDPIVFTWKALPGISYIVSSDMPVGTRGKRMAPGDELVLSDQVSVKAFDSTDLGVSFLVRLGDLAFFHAGDLNLWHWREESTIQEIEEAEEDFRKAVAPLCQEHIDVAFFPLDPRQGTMFDAGANYFILSVKPRILIPMHYFHRSDVAAEFARTASNRFTEVVAMPGYGESMAIETDEEGYLNLSFPDHATAQEDPDPSTSEDTPSLETIYEEDPFIESDLPLTQLASPEEPEIP